MKPLKCVALACALAMVAACTNLPAAAPVTQVVAGYCALPLVDRQVSRAVINSLLLPNTVAITCVGDTVTPAKVPCA